MILEPPRTWDDLRHRFGDDREFRGQDGRLTAKWETVMLATVKLPQALSLAWSPTTLVTKVRVHKHTADIWAAFFERVDEDDLWMYLNPFGGSYSDRPQRGSVTKPSLHAWGLALDFDPNRNKLASAAWRMPQEVVAHAKAVGLTWGGTFRRKDPMHFQFGIGL